MNISFHKNRTAKQKRNKRGALRTANKNKGTNICTHQHRHNPVNRHTTTTTTQITYKYFSIAIEFVLLSDCVVHQRLLNG